MRKRTKNKRYSCGLCKPHKKGLANRWKPKDELLLKEAEKNILNYDELWFNQMIYDAIDDFDFCIEDCCNGLLV